MNQQSEALRLADAIDPFVRPFAPDHLTSKVAADELRRLYSVNKKLIDTLEEIRDNSPDPTDRSFARHVLKKVDEL